MKKHPILKLVYVVLALVPISFFTIGAYEELRMLVNTINTIGEYDDSYFFYVYLITALLMSGCGIYGYIQAKEKGVSRYVFYISLLLVLSLPTLWYHAYYCVGKFCGILDFIFGIGLLSVAVGMIVVYYFGKFLIRKDSLNTFLKYFYLFIILLLVVEIPLLIAVNVFDYVPINFSFDTGKYLFDVISLPSDFIDTAILIIPAMILAIYPLKVAEAQYIDDKK